MANYDDIYGCLASRQKHIQPDIVPQRLADLLEVGTVQAEGTRNHIPASDGRPRFQTEPPFRATLSPYNNPGGSAFGIYKKRRAVPPGHKPPRVGALQ